MGIYLVLIVLIFLFFLFVKDKKKALLISFVFITFIAAFRHYTVGIDTTQFYKAYTAIGSSSTWDYSLFRYEPGFFYLCKILYAITKEPQFLIIVSSIFINFSVYKFIKSHSHDYLLSVYIYITSNLFFSNMNIMRQAIAIGVLVLAYKLLLEKKYFKYFIVILIASLFHTSAIAASVLILLVYALNKNKTYYKTLIIIGGILFMFSSSIFEFAAPLLGYESYINSEFSVSNYFGALIAFLFGFVLCLIVYIFSKSKDQKNSLENHFKEVVCNHIIIIYLVLLAAAINVEIFNRVFALFSIYLLIFIPNMINKSKQISSTNYKVLKIIVMVMYFLYFMIIGILRPIWYGCIPFNFFW